ncbi:MAG: hypothetical protein K2X81_09670 [Candidatus Obscuribacterales bacterium]|nr:hypothetical protein [Candidatus Obscuribacterales bacterium]
MKFELELSFSIECGGTEQVALGNDNDIIKKIPLPDKNAKSAVTRICNATEELAHVTSSICSDGSSYSYRSCF